jgi:hypothetical protein
MARPSTRARRASALAVTAAMIAPPLALAASDGGSGGAAAPEVQAVAPSTSGGAAAPAAPVPELQPTQQLAVAEADSPPVEAAVEPQAAEPRAPQPPPRQPRQPEARPRAVVSQETESPDEVPRLRRMGTSNRSRQGTAQAVAAVPAAGRLPHTGYLPLSVAILGLALLAAGTSTFLLVPRT